MVVAGLHDGNVAVYNLQRDSAQPSHQSTAGKGKHREPVWQVEHSPIFVLLVLFV